MAFGGQNIAGSEVRALCVTQGGTKHELAEDADEQRKRPEACLGGFFDAENEPPFGPSA